MVIARELTRALCARPATTPTSSSRRRTASAARRRRTGDVADRRRTSSDGRPIDQVISLRYPSYAVRHSPHVCWLNHTMREYYDLWDSLQRDAEPRRRASRSVCAGRFIHAADRYLLARNVTQAVRPVDDTIQQRLAIWPVCDSTVLYPPAPQRAYRCDGYGRTSSFRVAPDAAQARRSADSRAGDAGRARLTRGRSPATAKSVRRSKRLAAELGVADRVTFAGRLTDEASARPPRPLPRRLLSAVPGRLRLRDRRRRSRRARPSSPAATPAGRPSWSTDGVSGFVCEPVARCARPRDAPRSPTIARWPSAWARRPSRRARS